MFDETDRGLVSFFDIEECGFYKLQRGSEEPAHKFGTLLEVITDLDKWLVGKDIGQTLPWDPSKAPMRAKTYCRGMVVDPDTNDAIIVIYRAVGDHSGSIHGIKESSKVGPGAYETVVAGAEYDGEKIIWGQPCYYWIIPEHNKLASIRFPHSTADTHRLCDYIRDHVNNNSEFGDRVQKESTRQNPDDPTRVIRRTTTTFPYEDDSGKCNCIFKLKAKELKFNTVKEDLNEIHQKITHTVIRDTTRSYVTDARKPVLKIASEYLPSIFGKGPTTQLPKRIEVVVDGAPSIQELHKLFESRDTNTKWANVGFKMDGPSGATTWLSEYAVRSILTVNNSSGEDHYSPEIILKRINKVRDKLLAPIVRNEKTDNPSASSNPTSKTA